MWQTDNNIFLSNTIGTLSGIPVVVSCTLLLQAALVRKSGIPGFRRQPSLILPKDVQTRKVS